MPIVVPQPIPIPNPGPGPVPPRPRVQPPPINNPGIENVRRLYNDGKMYIEKPNDVILKNTLPNNRGSDILLE
jgi:hypothetical protein